MAFGASIAEGVYAMLAYIVFFELVGDSKILNYIMPLLKVIAALIIINVGRNFTQMTTSTFAATNNSPSEDSAKGTIFRGFYFSIVNIALVANHIALITAINPYHFVTFRKRYALFWGLGACVGMSSWFFILVNILKSYRKTLKIISVVWFLNNLGTFLIFVGIFSLFSIMWTLV